MSALSWTNCPLTFPQVQDKACLVCGFIKAPSYCKKLKTLKIFKPKQKIPIITESAFPQPQILCTQQAALQQSPAVCRDYGQNMAEQSRCSQWSIPSHHSHSQLMGACLTCLSRVCWCWCKFWRFYRGKVMLGSRLQLDFFSLKQKFGKDSLTKFNSIPSIQAIKVILSYLTELINVPWTNFHT